MKVTVGIIAYNEEKNMPVILENMTKQTFPHENIELILVDGMSSDKTKDLMEVFCNNNDFWQVKVIDNPKRIQAAGWNTVIDNAEGDVIIRLDAHSIIPDDFVAENAACIESGEDVCGGTLEQTIDSDNKLSKVYLSAETSIFGSSPAAFRRSTKKEYVTTLALGCYRKEVFQKVGKFNESLLRSEDNDMHYRIRRAGYKLCKSDTIHYRYLIRPTLRGMIKQKYGNGKWIGITSVKKTPKIFSLYHFIPACFVLGLTACLIVALLSILFPQAAVWLCLPLFLAAGSYCLLLFFISLSESLKNKSALYLLLLPFIICLLHIFYGLGTIVGIVIAPFVKVQQ